MSTVYALGAGGFITEVTVPEGGQALERWQEKLAKGEVSIIPEAHWVDVDGARQLVAGKAPDAAKPAPAKG